MIASIIFILLLLATIIVFSMKVRSISRNIKIGRPVDRSDRAWDRFVLMCKVAIGQSKMVVRPPFLLPTDGLLSMRALNLAP